MKALGFVIHSNILIALAALALTLATQVQMGWQPHVNAYLAVIFFATLFEYNFHRFKAVKNIHEAFGIEKLRWSFAHLNLIKTLIVSAFAGLLISLFFVRIEILYLLAPLALLSFLYSFSFPGKPIRNLRLLKIPGMKTLMIAFVWTAATVIVPIIEAEQSFYTTQVMLLFAERFAFIFAIAIPFDIRDMESDARSLLITIPIKFGESNALKISNIALLLSLSIATFHYLVTNMIFILPAYLFSIICTLIFINNKTLKKVAFYHHGILDGSILLHSTLIILSSVILS